MTTPLGTIGVWSAALRYGDRAAAAELAVELGELGYGTLWLPDVGGNLFGRVEHLLAATSATPTSIATGILNVWMHTATETAAVHHDLVRRHGDRLLFGLGVSHRPLVESTGAGTYAKPLSVMRTYLDELDAAPQPLAADDRVLAALGPKMVALAGARSAGVHTYLVTPDHTAGVREVLGDGPLVAPEQAVVLETDPEVARTVARRHLAGYLPLPNYSNNWRRLGFGDEDVADGGSDRLVDALVAWGDEDAIAARVQQHRDAGADHVCVQALGDDQLDSGIDVLRRLAPALSAAG